MKGLNNLLSILTCRGNVASNETELISAILGAERPRDFLFDLDHAHISFGQVVIKRHAKVIHKGQRFRLEGLETVKQILGWGLLDSPSLLGLVLRFWRRRIRLQPFASP